MAKIIQTEGTPNPNALKFVLDKTVFPHGSRSFSNPEEAKGDVIAAPLFAIEGVNSVFYMKDFVTVNKADERPWRDIAAKVYEIIPALDLSPLLALAEKERARLDLGGFDGASPEERFTMIEQILDRDVRPGLASDGGGLALVSVDGYAVRIHYQGACGSCPSARAGTLHYISSLLQEKVHRSIEVLSA